MDWWKHRTNKPAKRAQAINIATEVAKKDRSDPFTYRRTLAHLNNNVTCPEDYGLIRD